MGITTLATLITEIGILLGVIIPVIVLIVKLTNGQKCQLRSEMLRTYYHNKDTRKIRQYEYENFVLLYEVDKIYKEVQTWEIET